MTAGPPRRILVTGADGFVGRHLAPVLRQTFPDAALHLSRFELTDETAVKAAVRTAAPDACIHLAAVSAVTTAQSQPDEARRVNLDGALSLARTLEADAPGCTFLFVSTAEVYGRSFLAEKPLDEDAALNPTSVYGKMKADADIALGEMADGKLHIIRARPFNHIGPGQSDTFAVAAFAKQIASIAAGRQKPVLLTGALDPTRDFLDVRDVCACYVKCLVHRDEIPSGAIFNIASGQSRRMEEVLKDLMTLAGVDARIETDPDKLRPTEIRVAAGDATRARQALGWAPAIPWRQTLSDVLADWQTRIASEPS